MVYAQEAFYQLHQFLCIHYITMLCACALILRFRENKNTGKIFAGTLLIAGMLYAIDFACSMELYISALGVGLAMFGKQPQNDKTHADFPIDLFMDQFPKKIFFKDTSLVYRVVSRLYAKDMDCEPQDMFGKTDFDFYPPELAKKFQEDDKRILETKGSESIVEEYVHNSRRRVIKTVKQAVIGENGEPIGISGVIYDITEKVKLKENFEEQQRKMATLLSNLPGMAYRCLNTDEWTMEFVSDGCEKLTGYPPSAIIGNNSLSYNDLVYEPDRRMLRTVIHDKLSLHAQFEVEYRIVCKNQQVKWVWERGVGVFDNADNLVAIEGFICDITVLKTVEKQLKKSEKTLMAILQAAPVGIGMVNNRVIGWVNNRVSEITGYEPHELDGKNARMLYESDEEYLRVAKIKHPEVEKHGIGEVYTRWRRKDGVIRDIHLKSAALNRKNLSEGLIFTAIDVTDQIQAKIDRESLIKQLENQNAELEQFTYTVSHDLKSPIITIEGFMGLIERHPIIKGNLEIEVLITRVRNATKKMALLMEGLLELSRVGRLINPPVKSDLRHLIDEAVELVSGRIAKNNIAIRIEDNLPDVYVDHERIVMVLMNLIDNSAKAVANVDNPQIHIGKKVIDCQTVFFIKDNGIGIESQYFDRIFGLFNKLNAQACGTGVGLTLVKRIIEFHGGHIWVESGGINKGCTFFFTLPLVKAEKS